MTVRVAQASAQPLPGRWSLRALDGPIPDTIRDTIRDSVPADVPGLAHTALLDAGLIPDPYLDQNERTLSWIGETSWEYATSFRWTNDGHERHDLVFDGLDTVATVRLNGRVVGMTRNQHRVYRLPVDDVLRDGDNALSITFASPVREADRAGLELGWRPHAYAHPFNAIRKAACSFGWDWGPDLASVGLWRPARLEAWSGARIASVRPVVTVARGDGAVSVHVEVERTDDRMPLTVTATLGAANSVRADVPAGATACTIELSEPDVALWWPRGHGGQPLYDLAVALRSEGVAIAERSLRVGFRTIEVEREADDDGTSFRFVVNGERVWIRGANWIPDDAFITRVTRERLAERLDQAEFANLNLLRVWGGGVFESDDFYRLCDERGILVWQDFLFACAAYAEEEPLRSEVEAEARDNIARLMPHASLALWCGNNENLWGYEEWGWQQRLQGRSWGLGYYLDLLPRLVAELDPGRAYTAGSPWSGNRDIAANAPDHGTMHLWEQWNSLDYPGYRDIHPRFASEFGWQGPATWSTIGRAIRDDPLTPESPGMTQHQKATSGNDKLVAGLVAHLPLPDRTEDWHWAMSLNQALAMVLAIEHLRSLSPRCMGSIVWQLNDCWPATSWAAVDGYGRAKPLLYALRHAYADRLLTVQPRDGGLAAVAVNDAPTAWEGEAMVRRLRFDGEVLAEHRYREDLRPRAARTTPLPEAIAVPGNAADELIVVESGGRRALWFFAEYRDSSLAAAHLAASAVRIVGGVEVTVTARGLVRDLALLVDKIDPEAVVDDMLVTLLPGEQATFTIRTRDSGDPARFLAPGILRTGNELLG